MSLQFHPLANIFPLIQGDEFEELVADVAQHGVREPIWLHDGMILDGRNRYRAAVDAGIECPSRLFEGDDPRSFVVSLNLKRRHLDESQRAMAAAKLEGLEQGRPAGKDANLHVSGSATSEPISRSEAAKLLNVSPRLVADAKVVQKDAIPEVQAAVESGAVKVSGAAVIAKQPPEAQKRIVETGELKAAVKQLKDADKALKEARALPPAPKPTPDEKSEQARIFGTAESRAAFATVRSIAEQVAELPDPIVVVGQVPPALEHAVDIPALREVARWFDAFCNSWEAKGRTDVAA